MPQPQPSDTSDALQKLTIRDSCLESGREPSVALPLVSREDQIAGLLDSEGNDQSQASENSGQLHLSSPVNAEQRSNWDLVRSNEAASEVSSPPPPPPDTWDSLATRSLASLSELAFDAQAIDSLDWITEILRSYTCLDDFLAKAPKELMFWFFQQRKTFLSQKTMTKWSRDNLDDYILLPAQNGFVSRSECFFMSHFWLTQDHPDPDGECLRLLQAELRPQHWSYIWVDWTCIPQSPRTQAEETYFLRSLGTMPGIVRNCAFIWFYPPFEARLWILFEIAEFTLTSIVEFEATPDIREFKDHIRQMVDTSVRSVLDKYGYKCTHNRDKAFLTSWLEILILLRRLSVEIDDIRRIMDHLTWFQTTQVIIVKAPGAVFELCKFQGTFILNGERYKFTPFPKWVSSPIINHDTFPFVKGY
ncbi:uncharacterized protein A1O5_09088 [Cladophialophora psammophila CBS 110553]|uniref:Heterokaryon incompatibility domain-containing protein n=1 Tax=Cladophialophora psammophila CBS 110553 TaxID=1182543 RepID=W9WHY8_9EURO|nr:uncharacterized protein A1O5_09088 [Cladophialophora psammophila CBS 110553]EXJ67742.1 hypothetical protein A1O5_09088 [Cladophialophora psammophila CBS 110553]